MSCLFDSLSLAVGLHPWILRRAIVAYLKTNPNFDGIKASEFLKWAEHENLQEYTDKMLNPNAWGGDIEISAFCELYEVDVVVHVVYTGYQFRVETSKIPRRTIHIRYDGVHYEPMYTEFA